MKKYFLGVLTGFIVCTMFVSTFAVAIQPIKLIVNGNTVESDVPPQIINGRTMIPARPLAEALGADVRWDAESNAVVVTGGVQTGATPTDLENTPINPMVGKKALWREGFTINGKSIEEPMTFDSPGVHTMGFVTPDNFYLEEEILNNILSDMGLSAVQHKCPSPDVWFNSWYFISLKDVPSINFSYDDEEMNLTIVEKSASQKSISQVKEEAEKFILSEWISEYELKDYGVIATRDNKNERFSIQNKSSIVKVPFFILKTTENNAYAMEAFGENIRFRMVDEIIYVNKNDVETLDFFKNKIPKKNNNNNTSTEEQLNNTENI